MLPRFDPAVLRTPSYVVDLERIECNLRELDRIQRLSGAEILLATKGFAAWSVFSAGVPLSAGIRRERAERSQTRQAIRRWPGARVFAGVRSGGVRRNRRRRGSHRVQLLHAVDALPGRGCLRAGFTVVRHARKSGTLRSGHAPLRSMCARFPVGRDGGAIPE